MRPSRVETDVDHDCGQGLTSTVVGQGKEESTQESARLIGRICFGSLPADCADKGTTPLLEQGSLKNPGGVKLSFQELQTPDDKKVKPECWRGGIDHII